MSTIDVINVDFVSTLAHPKIETVKTPSAEEVMIWHDQKLQDSY